MGIYHEAGSGVGEGLKNFERNFYDQPPFSQAIQDVYSNDPNVPMPILRTLLTGVVNHVYPRFFGEGDGAGNYLPKDFLIEMGGRLRRADRSKPVNLEEIGLATTATIINILENRDKNLNRELGKFWADQCGMDVYDGLRLTRELVSKITPAYPIWMFYISDNYYGGRYRADGQLRRNQERYKQDMYSYQEWEENILNSWRNQATAAAVKVESQGLGYAQQPHSPRGKTGFRADMAEKKNIGRKPSDV